MKRKINLYLSFISSLLMLSSCQDADTSINYVDVNKPQDTISLPSTTLNDEYAQNNAYKKANTFEYTIKDVNDCNNWKSLKSIGNQKILVVPVQLRDGPTWTQQMLENLYTVFFSENGEGTNWESVHSFFYKSSYEQLNLMGSVYCNPLKIDSYTIYTFADAYKSNISNPTYEVAKQFYDSASTDLLKQYDQDKDGFIDSVVFCYSHKYNKDAYWAWVDYNTNFYSDTNRPAINTHMWVSYDFMNDTKNSSYPKGLDAHTYIHETGHLLGLDDYYNYDTNWNAAGELDMQSFNIGDHNIYSKLALGWVKPYIVNDTCTITIRTSSKYPDAIIFKDRNLFIDGLFGEYLILEYYTPTILNSQDSIYQYANRNKMYSYSGIRLYHVDARLVKNPKKTYDLFGNVKTTNDGYTRDLIDNVAIGASNSPVTWSNLESNYAYKYYYLHLIDEGLNNKLNSGFLDNKNVLWKEGSSFIDDSSLTYFLGNNGYLNDWTSVGFKFHVDSINGDYAKITFTKHRY